MVKNKNIRFKEDVINSRLRIFHTDNQLHVNSFPEDVREGLTSKDKFLSPKYFYDKRGSELFEQICGTEEYYPTRTETDILKDLSGIIAQRNTDKKMLVELGSGSSVKTDLLIKSFLSERNTFKYIPIDVSDIIIKSSAILTDKYPGLNVDAVISFYEEGMNFTVQTDSSAKLILFLGSSIGNFSGEERTNFMKMLKTYMNESDRLLIGFDMIKDKEVLEKAYNDRKGITAEFNLNILQRINNELGGNFDPSEFEHIAFYNESMCRIEMHLRARSKMTFEIKEIGEKISFEAGEMIHTENSYKFSRQTINELAENSGLEFSDYYADEKNYFSICAFKIK
ncbi:MAG TPA: L-histidine N(alpha)-methyltransferase [Ignavibacteria bacterium]|nr:L-histidine N(alpha)-methyltransferase [Ignavibacteria bacterium]